MTTHSSSDPVPRGRIARFTWIAVLVVGVGAYLLVLRTLVATENPNFVPSLILLGSVVVPTTVLVFAAEGGAEVRVGAPVIALTAVLGGVLGTVAAGTLEYDALHRLGALPMTVVAVIEEASKLAVPLVVLFALRARRDPKIGVVIGVASGAGFATLETMGYGFTALLTQRSLAAVDSTLLLRALLAPAGHVAWTGLTVAALWRIPGAAHRGRAVAVAVGTFVAAVLLHAAWDGLDLLWVHVVVAAVSIAALLVMIHRSHRGARPVRARRQAQRE